MNTYCMELLLQSAMGLPQQWDVLFPLVDALSQAHHQIQLEFVSTLSSYSETSSTSPFTACLSGGMAGLGAVRSYLSVLSFPEYAGEGLRCQEYFTTWCRCSHYSIRFCERVCASVCAHLYICQYAGQMCGIVAYVLNQ